MFRKLAKANKAISDELCIKLLKEQKRGILSVIGDEDYPYGMPLNHFYDEESGKIYFHSGNYGHRKESVEKNDKVSFCVLSDPQPVEGQWGLDFQSVVVFGRMRVVYDMDIIKDISRKLCYKFTQDEAWIEEEIEKEAKATILLELTPEHICGKFVNES
ncbi:MAG: pyridoxamine 5'-phosphate oxidase family protein [Firmicutes bacterium]|nr:pyridoxamine 5'-phosphate oxidase family protein [Bacillota bacterium]